MKSFSRTHLHSMDQEPDYPPEYTETEFPPSRRESGLTVPTIDTGPGLLPFIDTSGASRRFSGPTSPSPETASAFHISPQRRLSTITSVLASPSSAQSIHSTSHRSRRPQESIDYVFKPLSFDSMVLTSSEGTPGGSMPLYHISVRVNCFSPSFWVTTIRRGGSETGELVGEFEMGYSNAKPSSLSIRGRDYKLKSVFKVNFGDYTWTLPGRGLLWDRIVRRGTVFTCSAQGRTAVYAKFFPVTEFREPGQASALTKLVICPDGHELVDDILMSALIIERIRTGGTLA